MHLVFLQCRILILTVAIAVPFLVDGQIQGPPIILQPQNASAVPLGATLQCRASGEGSLKYYWERERSGNWVTVDSNNRTSYTTRNTGQYRCNVTNEVGSVLSPVITVYGRPNILTHPSSHIVTVGMSVILYCNVTGFNVYLLWRRRTNGSWSTVSNSQSYKYEVRNIQQYQQYRCLAGNNAGTASSNVATIQVLKIITHPDNKQAEISSSVTLTCTSSISSVTFTWTHNGTNIRQVLINGNTSRLTISNVRYRDGGTYACTLEKGSSLVTSNTATITVYALSSLFTTHPQDQFVHINEDTQFECAANGSESLTIKWTRNDRDISISRRFRILRNGVIRSVLQVKKSKIGDSGFYWCVATNADNEATSSKQAELLILPSINIHPDNVTILSGQSVNLTCSATGTDVVYQWMRNGVIISDDNSNVLRINEITQIDDGTYQCIANNKGGNATSNPAMIIVYDEPTINPLSPKTLGVLGEQFQITCNATNDKDAPHHMIFTWATPDGVDYNTNLTSEDDDHTASSTLYISRLARSDKGPYECHVTNNNIVSVVTSTTVIVEEHPSQPFNLNVVNTNATSLALNWNEPENFDEETDYYIIYYSDDKTMKTICVFNFTGLYILHNLTSSTQYSIYVRAVRLTGVANQTLQGNSSVKTTAITSSTTSFVQECDDNDDAQGTVAVAVFVVLLVVFLICCIGLIIIVFKLYRKIIFLQEKIKSTDEKLKVPNPTYADLAVNSDDINMESNPAYQCSSKQDDVKDHNYYETIITDDKSAANKSNTASD